MTEDDNSQVASLRPLPDKHYLSSSVFHVHISGLLLLLLLSLNHPLGHDLASLLYPSTVTLSELLTALFFEQYLARSLAQH